MQLSQAFSYLFPLRTKHSPQHRILEHHQIWSFFNKQNLTHTYIKHQ